MIRFTIATVTYNPGQLLERTIKSVEEQDWPFVQHVIVDGNSQDATLERVHHYQERNSVAAVPHEITCLSEPDKGLYDAMNKAIHLAKGDYILFLNAGDCFHSPSLLSQIARSVPEGHARPSVLYGHTDIVNEQGEFLRHRPLAPPENLTWKSFRQGMLVCHQAFFARTDLARKELYNLDYKYSADFDWCIRILRSGAEKNLSTLNLHTTVADYLEEGMTTRNHRASLIERFHIMRHHYGITGTTIRHLWFLLRTLLRLEAFRFVLVGGFATVLQYAFYLLFLLFTGANAALTIGYVLSFIANFALTSLFTFRRKATVKRGLGFGLAHLTNYLLQMVLLNVFLSFGIPKTWALLPVFAVCIPINFLLVRFVFKKR